MRRITFVLLLALQAAYLFGQGNSVPPRLWNTNDATTRLFKTVDEEPAPFVFKPTIGLGTGMFSYFGDVYDKNLANFQVSRIGFDLSVHQTLTPYLSIGFYTLFGKLGANERLIYRNINFESQIRVGGVHFEYNFQNFFRTKKNVSPWISVGFESFEFLSKTDLFDANGNRYYYWSDGSIRNLDENDPFANQASFLVRDYTYETDVRNTNPDAFGRYPERSFAVPVGAGFTMHLTDKWDATLGTTFHFTFTDYVDGVTAESAGDRQGNSRNDHFVMTSFGMRYNLTGKEKEEIDTFAPTDSMYVFNDEDYDGDGVLDLSDSCALTPKDVPVDILGCPLDGDIDNTADYRDDELDSPQDMVTDEHGVALTDSIIYKRWLLYNDSTGEYHAINETVRTGQNLAGTGGNERKVYMVSLGTYTGAISNEQMMRFLSVPDIGTHTLYDSSTAYTAGKFYDLVEAERRRKTLEAQGFPKPVIVYKTPEGKLVEVTGLVNNSGGNTNGGNNNGGNNNGGNNNGGVAGNNNGGNTNGGNTNGGNNNGGVAGNNNGGNTNGGNNNGGNNNGGNNNGGNNNGGLAGNNNGGNTNNGGNNNGGNNNGGNKVDPMPNDTGIVFRVQVGAFSKPISKSTFADVPNLLVFRTDDGLYKYVSGSYKTFQEASDAKAQLLVKGYSGAFIVAYKQGKRIPLEKAGAIYMKQEPQPQDSTQGAGTKSMVEFRVQLGAFRNEPPADVKAKLDRVAGVAKSSTAQGLTRYTVGSTADYKEITALRDKMKAEGFPDCFIIAFFKGEQVSVPEAIELSK